MWFSARFNFRPSTVFGLCQWYEPSSRIHLVYSTQMIPVWSSNIRKSLKKTAEDCSNICEWFLANKLIIHFPEDKTKSILFSSRRNLKLVEELDIRYKEIKSKQHEHVNFLACVSDKTMPGEIMALRVIGKITSDLKFLYGKIWFLDVTSADFFVKSSFNLILIMSVLGGTQLW